MPEISIIVPVYKVEKYLDRCITSILNQTFSDFELILVDDGSMDRCPQMCEEWADKDERIKVIHKENGGLSSARNAGLKEACGNYIGFVDSDDWILSDMYEFLYTLIREKNADIAMCFFARNPKKLEYGLGDKNVKVFEKEELFKFFYRINGEPSNYTVCCRLYGKDVIKNVWFREGKINEDVIFSYEAYQNANKMVFSTKKKYLYFENNEGITKSRLRKKDFDLLEIWDEIVKRERRFPEREWAGLNRMRATFTLYTKAFLYGYEDDVDKNTLIEWKKELKENYNTLKATNFFDWKRKIILFMLCKVMV